MIQPIFQNRIFTNIYPYKSICGIQVMNDDNTVIIIQLENIICLKHFKQNSLLKNIFYKGTYISHIAWSDQEIHLLKDAEDNKSIVKYNLRRNSNDLVSLVPGEYLIFKKIKNSEVIVIGFKSSTDSKRFRLEFHNHEYRLTKSQNINTDKYKFELDTKLIYFNRSCEGEVLLNVVTPHITEKYRCLVNIMGKVDYVKTLKHQQFLVFTRDNSSRYKTYIKQKGSNKIKQFAILNRLEYIKQILGNPNHLFIFTIDQSSQNLKLNIFDKQFSVISCVIVLDSSLQKYKITKINLFKCQSQQENTLKLNQITFEFVQTRSVYLFMLEKLGIRGYNQLEAIIKMIQI